jgi:hypothetical protein
MRIDRTGSRARVGRRAIAAVMAMLAFSVAVAVPASAGTEPTDDAERLLAVVTARAGTFREVADGYRLVLTGVVPRATWFSDRPAREVGSFTIEEVAKEFFAGSDAPNAAFEIVDGRGAGDIIVIEISNPRYQARRSRLVLDARVLTKEDVTSAALQHHVQRSTSDVPARFGPATLYIDDATACPSTFWTFEGELGGLSGINCAIAQQVASAASAAHPVNDGAGQYLYDFQFLTETWSATDQEYHASFTRTDHDVQQSFEWTCTEERCGARSGAGSEGEEPE